MGVALGGALSQVALDSLWSCESWFQRSNQCQRKLYNTIGCQQIRYGGASRANVEQFWVASRTFIPFVHAIAVLVFFRSVISWLCGRMVESSFAQV